MGEKGSAVTAATPTVPRPSSGPHARLWAKGTRVVRMRCTTSVCVHMLSMNQPAWKVPAKRACPAASSVPQAPPATAGHTQKNSAANVMTSKTELRGPKVVMKPRMPSVSQRRGVRVISSSTLSQGTAVQVRS